MDMFMLCVGLVTLGFFYTALVIWLEYEIMKEDLHNPHEKYWVWMEDGTPVEYNEDEQE